MEVNALRVDVDPQHPVSKNILNKLVESSCKAIMIEACSYVEETRGLGLISFVGRSTKSAESEDDD